VRNAVFLPSLAPSTKLKVWRKPVEEKKKEELVANVPKKSKLNILIEKSAVLNRTF
jgi:P2-related tail formation protein